MCVYNMLIVRRNTGLSARRHLVGIHGSIIITVYLHLLVLSLLSEIVYNALKKEP